MACSFSCFLSFTDALKENDVGVFQSDTGDVYKVKYKSNVCRDLLLRIEWTIPKQILFTVKLYSTSFKRCFSSKGMVIHGKKAFMKLRGAFNVSNFRNYKVLCVINLIPYIKFDDSNELPSELFDNFECVESEFQQSSMDENISNMNGEIRFRNEKTGETRNVKNNLIFNVNEINLPKKCENARPLNDMVHGSSRKSDSTLSNIAITDEMMIEDSNMANSESVPSDKYGKSVPIMNKDSSSLHGHDDKIEQNTNVHTVCMENFERKKHIDMVYLQNYENRENYLEGKVTGNCEEALTTNSYKQNNESALSNETYPEKNYTVRSNSQNEISNTKIPIVDYSEEIIENIKAINIHNNIESNARFSENNSCMEVDLSDLSSESHPVLYEEDISLSNSDNTASDKSSNNISRQMIRTEKMEFHSLFEDKGMGYSQEVVKSANNSKNIKADFILESEDISLNKNNDNEKEYGEKCLTSLSNCNIDRHIQNSDLPKIDNDADPSILRGDSLQTIIQESSEIMKIAEINDTTIDSQKSESSNLSSSKTDLVFRTLVHKLTVTDCDFAATGSEEEIACSSSTTSLRKSQGSEIPNRKYFPIMESELKGLSMDMLDLLTSGDMADAEITNGEKHIKVHRAILSARSSALKKLFFKHKTDDISYSAVVEIPSYILEDVIVFLYVGLVYIKSSKMAQDLLQVAKRYSINDLIDICSKHI